jgi:hypothetical protein
MADFQLPPGFAAALREAAMTAGRIGYRALSAAVAEGLRGVSELTSEADARVKRGARKAREMADTGKPYNRDDEEEDNDAQR